ncbi:type II toxin-antitoxin system Phd/YefM family antitoxin [Sphaerisporangium sp. NPDC088356]|uniref:type II toxin-antitoxin system Phd/YefM family antitoxin n=1 Tax=Sphaerisporangium sp. NPDC088356 TaxID=3154871 RepID=UPI003447D9BF
MGQWQLQAAKQRLSEVIRQAHDEGPQVVTRHGEEVAVIIDIAEYRRLRHGAPDFKEFLRSSPPWDKLELPPRELPREAELGR